MVGSSAEQTYALICKNCKHHNGLAIKEEFEYMEWRCAFCHFLNVARLDRFRNSADLIFDFLRITVQIRERKEEFLSGLTDNSGSFRIRESQIIPYFIEICVNYVLKLADIVRSKSFSAFL